MGARNKTLTPTLSRRTRRGGRREKIGPGTARLRLGARIFWGFWRGVEGGELQ